MKFHRLFFEKKTAAFTGLKMYLMIIVTSEMAGKVIFEHNKKSMNCLKQLSKRFRKHLRSLIEPRNLVECKLMNIDDIYIHNLVTSIANII